MGGAAPASDFEPDVKLEAILWWISSVSCASLRRSQSVRTSIEKPELHRTRLAGHSRLLNMMPLTTCFPLLRSITKCHIPDAFIPWSFSASGQETVNATQPMQQTTAYTGSRRL